MHTKLCGSKFLTCTKIDYFNIMDETSNEYFQLYRHKCNCLPACTSIKYDVNIDRVRYSWNRTRDSIRAWTDEEMLMYVQCVQRKMIEFNI